VVPSEPVDPTEAPDVLELPAEVVLVPELVAVLVLGPPVDVVVEDEMLVLPPPELVEVAVGS
jgi:hypothetical protein